MLDGAGGKEAIEERCELLRETIADTTSEYEKEKVRRCAAHFAHRERRPPPPPNRSHLPRPASLRPQVQERLAKLSGGVAVLKVGGATETEVSRHGTPNLTPHIPHICRWAARPRPR